MRKLYVLLNGNHEQVTGQVVSKDVVYQMRKCKFNTRDGCVVMMIFVKKNQTLYIYIVSSFLPTCQEEIKTLYLGHRNLQLTNDQP